MPSGVLDRPVGGVDLLGSPGRLRLRRRSMGVPIWMPFLDELTVAPSCREGRHAWLDAEDAVRMIKGSVHERTPERTS